VSREKIPCKFKAGDPAVLVLIDGRVYHVVIHAVGRLYITHRANAAERFPEARRHRLDYWDAAHPELSILLTPAEFKTKFDRLCTRRAVRDEVMNATAEEIAAIATILRTKTTGYEVNDATRHWLTARQFRD